jgi:hypothetical protein
MAKKETVALKKKSANVQMSQTKTPSQGLKDGEIFNQFGGS